LWEYTLDEVSLERIEMMIYKLRLQDLKESIIAWKSQEEPSLFEGALLVINFTIQKSIWRILEIN
jgi:hypothetical protein